MEWIASASAFVILFCGFLFYSDLLTETDSDVVLWCTVFLLGATYSVLFVFVLYDLKVGRCKLV